MRAGCWGRTGAAGGGLALATAAAATAQRIAGAAAARCKQTLSCSEHVLDVYCTFKMEMSPCEYDWPTVPCIKAAVSRGGSRL